VNCKAVTIFNGEIHEIFEEEREDIDESFEDETMGEPIYDEEYVGDDFCEVFEEEGKRDPIYDDEYVPEDINEVFEKKDKEEPLYGREYAPTEYDESLEVEKSLQTTTTKDMDCNVIVDNKSCENVASNYIAEKFKSQPIEHQDPYKLQWLNKDNEVKVSQHDIASFSIRKNYKQRLWFDVIPMDGYHILHERPWQYDRYALYNGYANTCTFGKDVIEIKLAPLPLNEFNDRKDEYKLLGLSIAKEQFKDKTKLCLLRPIPKPPWEVVIICIFPLDYFGLSNRRLTVFF